MRLQGARPVLVGTQLRRPEAPLAEQAGVLQGRGMPFRQDDIAFMPVVIEDGEQFRDGKAGAQPAVFGALDAGEGVDAVQGGELRQAAHPGRGAIMRAPGNKDHAAIPSQGP